MPEPRQQRSRLRIRAGAPRVMEFGRRTPEAGSAGPTAAAAPRRSCILKL